MPTSIQLDTGSIEGVLKNDEALYAFVAAAKRRRWTVSISRLVFEEMFATTEGWQVAKSKKLQQLAEALPGRFLITRSARELWPLELDQCISGALPAPDSRVAMMQIQYVARTGRIDETDLPNIVTTVNGWKEARWMKSDRNNWFDAGVAASAAYMDAFVTKDKNLMKRCRWLRKHGCLTFETVTLEQLYARTD